MSLRYYMDVHIRRAVTVGLRSRGVDVVTSQEVGTARLPDPALLDRASLLDRVLFTQDDDLLVEANRRQQESIPFAGVVYCHQLRLSVGGIIEDLELLAKCMEPADLKDRVEYLPL